MKSNKETIYYCGPQSWPVWIRRILSKYYNRPCRNHDYNYSHALCSFEESELEFKEDVSRRRKVLRKAWKRSKVKLGDYLLHGLVFGYILYRFTRVFGKWYKQS